MWLLQESEHVPCDRLFRVRSKQPPVAVYWRKPTCVDVRTIINLDEYYNLQSTDKSSKYTQQYQGIPPRYLSRILEYSVQCMILYQDRQGVSQKHFECLPPTCFLYVHYTCQLEWLYCSAKEGVDTFQRKSSTQKRSALHLWIWKLKLTIYLLSRTEQCLTVSDIVQQSNKKTEIIDKVVCSDPWLRILGWNLKDGICLTKRVSCTRSLEGKITTS